MILTGNASIYTWGGKDWIFPVYRGQYWFCTVYLLIYLLSPFLNKLIKALKKKELAILLGILLFLYCILPTLFFGWMYGDNNTEAGFMYYNRFLWLVIIYFIGAWLRLYSARWLTNKTKAGLCFLITGGVTVGYIIGVEYISVYYTEQVSATYFWHPNTVFMLLLSISLFLIFRYMKVLDMAIVNYIASCTLGIYMLHDGILGDVLWIKVFKNATHVNSRFFLIHIGIAVALIVIAGILIDTMRKILERYTIEVILNSSAVLEMEQRIEEKYRNI